MWAAVLTRLDVVVAAIAILGALKTAYNGTLRRMIRNIGMIPSLKNDVDEMAEKQEQMIDGMVALSVAESHEETTVDTDRLAQELRNGQSYRVYLERGGRPSNPYTNVEDEMEEVHEEERRWRGPHPRRDEDGSSTE